MKKCECTSPQGKQQERRATVSLSLVENRRDGIVEEQPLCEAYKIGFREKSPSSSLPREDAKEHKSPVHGAARGATLVCVLVSTWLSSRLALLEHLSCIINDMVVWPPDMI